MRRILCFGDSNTYGYDPRGGRYDENTRWTKRLDALLGDGWTVVTKDHSLSAQWEHTCLVTETGVEVLTLGELSKRPDSFKTAS